MTEAYVVPVAPAASMVGPDTFRFLNVETRCATVKDWNDPDRALLWTYNLHYFDDLNADAHARRDWHLRLVERWIAENPPARGSGWDPYPVSRRIVNWVKWALSGERLSAAANASLAVQTRWLTERIEYHLLGNHLFANAKALMHAGLYFDGPEAAGFLRRGLRIVDEQLLEQILPDGGHFELSTQYHAVALEDLLDLVNVMQAAGQAVPASWLEMVGRMHRWLRTMTHPDGEISFFNDSSFGIAPTADQLAAYAVRLGHAPPATTPVSTVLLRDSGYARLENERLTLLADCAAIGPDYLPAHGHADTLSFEMSVDGRRVFVNSGTSEYGRGDERSRQRGTAAHNTVIVDGQDSSEVWAGFRVARRARPLPMEQGQGAVPTLQGAHDGYRRLPGRNLHRRRWTLLPRELRIEDHVSGAFERAEGVFHLHPEVAARATSGNVFELTLPGAGRATLGFDGASAVELRSGTWHPRFGVTLGNLQIVARFGGANLTSHFVLD